MSVGAARSNLWTIVRDSLAGASDPPASASADDRAGRRNLLLLVQLRWIAVLGQVVTILVVRIGFGAALPFGAMEVILAALLALNLASLLRLRRPGAIGNLELLAALAFDVIALSGQLYLTGGANNPFVFLYLLQVTLGAVLLEAWSSWSLVALATSCFAAMIRYHRPLPLLEGGGAAPGGLTVVGMLSCFILDAALLVVFVTRVTGNIRDRDARLAGLRQQAAEEDHIVRIGLLASGAAHELGTPLATLSVILNDWARMPAVAADPDLCEDVEAMQAEVQRCKVIVTGILASAGEARGESATATTARAFVDEIVRDWRDARGQPPLEFRNEVTADRAIVSDSTLKQMVFNVLDNALEASPRWLALTASIELERMKLVVTDIGHGFPPEVLPEIGKPYQSTKGRRGGGLGLFLVFNVVRKLGGEVTVENRSVGGARVAIDLPLAALSLTGETDHG